MQTPGFDRTRDVLVFLSIPKTGSTSLSEMLIDAIGPDASCHLPDRQVDAWNQGLVRMQDQLRRSAMRFRDRILRRDWALAQATFLHGHHPFWAPIPGWRRPVYITLMRDPLARTLSGYFYIRQKAERMRRMSPTKRRILSCDPDDFFLDLLDSHAACRLNGQCLYLARSGQFEDAAKTLRNKLRMVGTLEHLGEFAREISDGLDIPIGMIKHANKGRHPNRDLPISTTVERKLRAALEPDYRLYDLVQSGRV